MAVAFCAASAQAQAPTVPQRVAELERGLDSLGYWMEHCPAGMTPRQVRTKRGVERVYALVLSKRQVRAFLTEHGDQH